MSGSELIGRSTDLDRVVLRIAAPLEPTAIVDRNSRPAHEMRVEPGLARPPARPAVERHPLVGRDAGVGPVPGDLRVRAHRVVDVPVVLHVVGVRPAVAPDVAGDSPCRLDVVVTTDLTDVLTPGADAHQ